MCPTFPVVFRTISVTKKVGSFATDVSMAFAQSVLKLSGNKKQAYTKVLLKFLLMTTIMLMTIMIIMMMMMITISSFADELN